MEGFLIYLLKSCGVALLFLLSYQLLLQRETFFTANRRFLITGLICSLGIPMMTFTKTVWIQLSPAAITSRPTFMNTLSSTAATFDWLKLIFAIYLIGIIIFASRLLLQLLSLRKLISKSRVVKVRTIHQVETDVALSPFSFFRYVVYHPKKYSKRELQTILAHEKVHVDEGHSFDILLTELMIVFQWFNPFIWLYKTAVQQNLEFKADAKVLQRQNNPKEYQYLLLRSTPEIPKFSFVNPFFSSLVKKRIVMINTSKSRKRNTLKYTLILPLLVGFVFLFNQRTEAKIKPLHEMPKIGTEALQDSLPEPKVYTIDKKTTDKELDHMKKEIGDNDSRLRIKSLKRNKKGLIISIALDFEIDKGGTVSGNYHNENGIASIYFGSQYTGGVFITTQKKGIDRVLERKPLSPNDIPLDSEVKFVHTDKEGNTQNDLVKISYENGERKLYLNGEETSMEALKKLKIAVSEDRYPPFLPYSGSTTITTQDDEGNKIIGRAGHVILGLPDGEKPYILLDGKQIPSSAMDTIQPGNIKGINILKGEEALQKYGHKGKYGVVIVTMKNPEALRLEAKARENDFSAIIHKNTSDRDLNKIKMNMLKNELSLSYDQIERNENGEIIKIKISLDDKILSQSGSSTFENDENPIPNILVGRINGQIRVTSSIRPEKRP